MEYSEDDGKSWQLFRGPLKHRTSDWTKNGYKKVTVDLVVPEYNYSIMVGRDYWLFGIMAGVRSVPTYIVENGLERAVKRATGKPSYNIGVAKGLPTKLSPEMKAVSSHALRPNSYGHTPSWCTCDELKFWLTIHKNNFGHLYGWARVRDAMEKMEKKGLKTRLLFWFDS